MNVTAANVLLNRFGDVRRSMFSVGAQVLIAGELIRLREEKIYIDLRNTSEAKMIELIEVIERMPSDQVADFVSSQPLTLQAFLYDRTHCFEKWLSGLGVSQVEYEDRPTAFLRWALVERWRQRDVNTCP